MMSSTLAATMLAFGLLALGLPLLAGEAAASPPYTDCNTGVVVGGHFTGLCGNLSCGAIVVQDKTEANFGGPSC
jgi:hypothetical protein